MDPNPGSQAKSNDVHHKKSKDHRKIDEKSIDSVMRSLNGISSPDEKISAIGKKYSDVYNENRLLTNTLKQWEKKCVLAQREKDQILLENNKNMIIKEKLESLCRELQKQNKAVKDESLQKLREEEEKRKKMQEKLQSSFNEITALMQQNNEKNNRLRDDNIDMTEKFKSVIEQYEIREQQVDKMTKHMALEAQLADAKLNKANLEVQAEREKMCAEKEKLLLKTQVLEIKCKSMQTNEIVLLQQIAVCNEKISEFQEVLNKRNTIFGELKGELEKMSKKILKLEKENIDWKQKWEKSHRALLEMAVEKKIRDQNTLVQSKQVAQMQRLCRIMKAERTGLLGVLKEHNIERPPFQQIPEVEIIAPVETDDKMDAMTANCARLKQNLAHLQGELNAYVNKSEKKDETPQAVIEEVETTEVNKSKTKPKKGKNKKSKQNNATNETTPVTNADTKSIETENVLPKTEEVCTENVLPETTIELEKKTAEEEVDIKCENNPAAECVVIDSVKPVDLDTAESQNDAKEKILEETQIVSDSTAVKDIKVEEDLKVEENLKVDENVKVEEVNGTENVITPILENKDVKVISST